MFVSDHVKETWIYGPLLYMKTSKKPIERGGPKKPTVPKLISL